MRNKKLHGKKEAEECFRLIQNSCYKSFWIYVFTKPFLPLISKSVFPFTSLLPFSISLSHGFHSGEMVEFHLQGVNNIKVAFVFPGQ